jgi:hypothetical protein
MHQAAIRQWREPVRHFHGRDADYISQILQKRNIFPQGALLNYNHPFAAHAD